MIKISADEADLLLLGFHLVHNERADGITGTNVLAVELVFSVVRRLELGRGRPAFLGRNVHTKVGKEDIIISIGSDQSEIDNITLINDYRIRTELSANSGHDEAP